MSSAALVVGARGGIGEAMVSELRASEEFDVIIGSTRRVDSGDMISDLDVQLPLDLADESSIETFVNLLSVHLNEAQVQLGTVLICSGLLHADGIRPERRSEDLHASSFERLMRINALGPLQLIAQLKSLIPRDEFARVAAISARVGSIQDNRLGGWYSYRCSKAALNMGVRNLSIELARTHPRCVLTLFHPGTVDTALSQPFQSGVAEDKLFTVQRAARHFWALLKSRVSSSEDLFIDWAGKPIAF